MRSLYRWQHDARQWLAGRMYCWRFRQHVDQTRLAEIAKHPRKVLIVIAGLIGDSVMSAPVVTAARQIWPRARLTLLGQRHNCDLFSGSPDFDDQIETTVFPFTLRRRGALRKLQERLTGEQFDVALLVLGDQFALLLARIGIPVRVGVRGHPLQECFTHIYDIGEARTWGPDERLNALRVLGHNVAMAPPRLAVSEAAVSSLGATLSALGVGPGEPFCVVHPFGSTQRQWWPLERVPALAEYLRDVHGLTTVLVGGVETCDVSGELAVPRLVDARGSLTIQELLATLSAASIVISTDSGPFHVAGALGSLVVGLFRERRPEHGTHYGQARVIYGQEGSCSSACAWDRCHATTCLQLEAIGVSDVARVATDVLEARPLVVTT